MNIFTALARIGNDPEQRYTPTGDSVVSFNGAVDSGYGKNKVTTWIRFVLWGKRGESLLPYLAKGAQVVVSGELANQKWQDKDGQDRYTLECKLNDLALVSSKSDTPKTSSTHETNLTTMKPDNFADDIPF